MGRLKTIFDYDVWTYMIWYTANSVENKII